MDIRELKDKIQNFRWDGGDLGSQGYTRVLLQVFGYLGHGKSSFINSCKYVLEGGEQFTEYAVAGETFGTQTMIKNAYPLTNLITIVDNRGCSRLDDFQKAGVFAQLGVVPIVVLTFKTAGDYQEIERRFQRTGAQTVIAIENYTTRSHIKTLGTSTDILMVIYKALENVRYRLDQPREPRKERIDRKKFLLNYIYEISANQERQKEREIEEREKERKSRESRKWNF